MLSGFTPNIEAIAKYRPDLVLIDTDANHIVEQLGKVQIPVLVEPPAANLNDVYAADNADRGGDRPRASRDARRARTSDARWRRSCARCRARRRR